MTFDAEKFEYKLRSRPKIIGNVFIHDIYVMPVGEDKTIPNRLVRFLSEHLLGIRYEMEDKTK